MRRLARSIIAILLSLVLAALSAALTFPNPIPTQGNLSSGAYYVQTTPAPEADKSEIGSTDGIMIMGGVIVAIIIIPIFLKRKSWLQS
jgi:hypothetical protein